jgi:acyl-CoA thioester hydrolase
MSDAVLPTSGALEGATHLFPVRVYYEDTDAGGIVYHANYLRFAERARSECLRMLGWPYERMVGELDRVWVVRRAEIDFRLAARLDDALVVATSIGTLGRASIDAVQIIRRDAVELVRLKLQLVLVRPSGQLSRIPAILLDAFDPVRNVDPSEPEAGACH